MARKKGRGRVFLRGKTWYMRWRCNGIETTRTTGVDASEPHSREKAENALAEATEILRLRDKRARLEVVKSLIQSTEERMRELVDGVAPDLTMAALPQVFEKSSRRIDCSPAMLETYKRYIGEIASIVGRDFPVSALDARVADRIANRLSQDRSPNTYNKHLNGLTLVWRAIMPVTGISANPWADMPRKRLDTHTRRILTVAESDAILSTAQGELRTLIAIGLHTGLRMGDAVHLRWGDIRDGAIFVATSKTKARVAIPLHPRLSEMLGQGASGDGLILPEMARLYDVNGKAAVSGRVKRLFRRCGIETSRKVDGKRAVACCGFHSLRHTFVSRCIDGGVPPHVVQAIVGHTTAKMTEHYTHLADKTILDAFSAVK